jgi:hypothetical protein
MASLLKKFATTRIIKPFTGLTPTLYAHYMMGGSIRNGHKAISALIEVASVKALQNDASRGMSDVLNMVKNWDSPDAQQSREGAVNNGAAKPGKSSVHVLRAN